MKKTYLIKYVFLLLFVMSAVTAFAQTGVISGKVLDENNQTLPGVTVTVKGTQKSTSTDINGAYRLTGIKAGTVTLQFSFVGYKPMEKIVNVSGNVTVDASLVPGAKDLAEVVVIGYGTQQKKDLTSAITNVTSKDFNTGNITSPENLIQGKVAGVSIISNSGAPGAASTIRIRGGASIYGGNDPLIVVDGVPISNDGIQGVADPLALINPNDIESFSVLKDASAAAIYGNRGSNGVIIITTKKGAKGKPKINFSTQFSIANLPKEAPVLSPSQFRTYVAANDTAHKFTSLLGTANTDWQKEIYQTSYSTDNNLSVTGTVGKLPYRVSVGYTDQNGILKTTGLERYTGSVNLSPSLFTDHLKLNFNFLGTSTKQRFANEGGVIGSAVDFNPTLPVYSGNSNFGGYYELLDPSAADGLKSLAPLNPVGLLYENNNRSHAERMITSLAIDYKVHFFPDLHVNLEGSYDGSKDTGYDIIPAYAASQYPGANDANGVLQRGTNSRYGSLVGNTSFDGYLSYSHNFTAIKSNVTAEAGYESQIFKNTGYNYPTYFSNGEVNPLTIPIYAKNINQYDLTAFFARATYAYDNKYLLEGTFRQDVSTKFDPATRSGVFPSVSAGWVISQEDFLKNNPVLTNLKLRAGYGVTGNQEGFQYYNYLADYSLSTTSASYQFGNTFYQMYRPGPITPEVWERTATFDVGLDYGFLNDRISGTLDYYHRTTSNLIAPKQQSAGANFASVITSNVGDMVDNGVELNINAKLIAQKDIAWNVGFNATLSRNKITKLQAIPQASFQGFAQGGISGGTGNYAQIDQVGYPRNAFFLYQQVYGSNGKPIDGVFVDRNADGQINNQDLKIEHSPDPQEYLGINSDFNYKKWGIGFVARASFGNYVYDNVASSTGIQRNILNPIGVLNNGDINVLQSGLTGNGQNDLLSDYYLYNASFFRMDNAHLSYNFGKIFKTTGDLRVSFNVQNVFIITKYPGVDPEVANGIDNNFYPRPRTYVIGLNLGL